MTNLIILSYSQEDKAVQASQKLAELETIGDISIFEKVIVKKGANGEITFLQTASNDGLRMVSGMAIGTLVGAIAGPVGMLIGMLSGTLLGTVAEADYFNFSEDILRKVSDRLKVGDVAILAEINEDNPIFVDGTLAPLGGKIFRADVEDVYSNYEDEQITQFEEEIAEERKLLKAAIREDKEKINKKIEQLKEKRNQRIAELKDKVKDKKRERLTESINKEEKKISELKESLNKL